MFGHDMYQDGQEIEKTNKFIKNQGKEVQEEYVDEGELSEEEYNYHIVI